MNQMNQSYIVDAKRTPIGKKGGWLSQIHPVDLGAYVLNALISDHIENPDVIEDLIMGCVTQINQQGLNIARNTILSAGLPESIPGVTVDRQCGSSLQAIQFACHGVEAGYYDVVIAGGVESMSNVPLSSNISNEASPLTESISRRYNINSGWFSQAKGAELIAKKYNMSKSDLATFSYISHMKAHESRNWFKNEIIPITIDNNQTVDKDQCIRPDTTVEKILSLPEAFPGVEMINAGNSSQISDGSSFTMITSEKGLKKTDSEPIAKISRFASIGTDPVTMLLGPINATHKLLERSGMKIGDFDCFEINEAFAPVPLAWQKEFHVDDSMLNIFGGAIALGHPVGATGCRILTTILNVMKIKRYHLGLIAICEGGGMANACIVEMLN